MVTVAILGGGFMGGAHANNYAALGERVRVKTVYSRTEEKARRVAELVGAEASTDLEATIADPALDAVDVCLPTPLHRTVAERSLFSGQIVNLRWGGLPPAAEAAVGVVLGKTATQRIALSRTDDVPICTDATPCKHSATNPRFSDHSDGTDPLATVRRYKVDIAVVGP